MRRKKILFVNSNQFGYHTDYLYFAKYLSHTFSIDYICYDRKRDRIELPGINIIYLDFPRYRIYRSIYFLQKTLAHIRENEFDIVFADYFKLVFFIGFFGKCKNSILDIRTGSLKKSSLLRYIENLFIHIATKSFKITTILSEGLADKLKLKKYNLLPLGAESYFYGNHKFNELNLLYVGALNQRNIKETIEGLYLFTCKHQSVKVTYDIIGFGNDDDIGTINETIKKYGLDNIVKFNGRKTKSDLIPFFAKCNIGVSYVPITPWYDNQPPTKTFEYVLSGMACIATATTENKKFVNNINGILCQDNSASFSLALKLIWQNRDKYISEAIRSSLSDYTWEKITTKKLIPILQEMTN